MIRVLPIGRHLENKSDRGGQLMYVFVSVSAEEMAG
jgi:hypothetical protein